MKPKIYNLDLPMYGVVEAARYLRLPYPTLKYWVNGSKKVPPLIKLPASHTLSFANLLECHILSAMRSMYDLRLPRIRNSIAYLDRHFGSPHPLLEHTLHTDRVDLFLREMDNYVKISRGPGQLLLETMTVHLERIEKDTKGLLKFFPFVMERKSDEPRLILIDPQIGFGKPVIAGTGISTAVIASRFNARESISELAEEYGCNIKEIEEAIRWETGAVAA